MELGEPDESGRARPVPLAGSSFEIEADALVLAIGYNVEDGWGEVVPALERDSWGRFTVDPRTMRTNRTGVFAGGDDVNGADLVVTALADAHVAAASIEDWLERRRLVGARPALGAARGAAGWVRLRIAPALECVSDKQAKEQGARAARNEGD